MAGRFNGEMEQTQNIVAYEHQANMYNLASHDNYLDISTHRQIDAISVANGHIMRPYL